MEFFLLFAKIPDDALVLKGELHVTALHTRAVAIIFILLPFYKCY